MGFESRFKCFGNINFLYLKTKVFHYIAAISLLMGWIWFGTDLLKLVAWRRKKTMRWWGWANGLNPWLISLHFAVTFGQIQFEPIRFNWSCPLASSWVCFWHRFWPDGRQKRFSLGGQFSPLGEASKKKLFFFFQKNSEILRPPPPLSAIRKPQFFLIRKFRNWRDPPPFGEKFRNILSFLWWNPYGLDETPPFGKNRQNPLFLW